MIHFLRYKNFYFIFSGTLVLASIVFLFMYGLNFGIEFTGGSALKVVYKDSVPSENEILNQVKALGISGITLRKVGINEIEIRMKDISEEKRIKLFESFKNDSRVEKDALDFEKIGAAIGQETKKKALKAIILAIIAIIIYIAFAFRQISRPVKSWEYGLAAVIALCHDVLIPIGVFAFLGHFMKVPFTVPILTALLTILGYSVNDTVVVFDRIRENLLKQRGGSFEEIVDQSLNQTLVRSINTSLTTLIVLFAIFFFGGITLKYFALALIIGIASGTYSSIFLASPLVVVRYHSLSKKRK